MPGGGTASSSANSRSGCVFCIFVKNGCIPTSSGQWPQCNDEDGTVMGTGEFKQPSDIGGRLSGASLLVGRGCEG